jgi:hypothetical protein
MVPGHYSRWTDDYELQIYTVLFLLIVFLLVQVT